MIDSPDETHQMKDGIALGHDVDYITTSSSPAIHGPVAPAAPLIVAGDGVRAGRTL
jgi:hypothetical protein